MKRLLFVTGLVSMFTGYVNAQFWKTTEPVKLEGTINSEAEESIPIFSADSSLLYFVRTFDEDNKGGLTDQDIWYSVKDENGAYGSCKRLTSLNNKFNNAVVGLGMNGSKMYLFNAYDGKKDQEKGIAFSEGSGTGWKSPEKIEIPGLDIEGNFYGFHVSEKEDVIIISYAGEGTLGEEDLYYSTLNGDTWTSPKHMGKNINSKGFEISPFLSPNQDTLFFSSNGFGGEGDADIFYSVKQGAWDNWSEPKNLGNNINSPKFDAYFTYSGNEGYWSSNRDSERSDIYMVNILTPPPISVACTSLDASVYKGEDGSIDLTVTGGAPPFKFEWSNERETEDIAGLSKGEYTVTVIDDVGQTGTTSCFVDEPPMPIDPVVVKEYENLEFKHNFGYNKNKVSVSKGKLRKFLKAIEDQLEDGRESVTINVVSSASKVPTKKFGTNENLAKTRGDNIKYDIVAFFEKRDKYKGKVNVVISSTLVDGPEYEEDSANRSKYEPFQFVSLKTQ